jgi:hypothetical protein
MRSPLELRKYLNSNPLNLQTFFRSQYWQTKLKIQFPPFPTSFLSLYNGDTLASCQDILWIFSM